MKKNKESYSIHVYTLRDKTTKSIKIESWRSLREEMQVLGITDSDIFQIQMIEITPNKKRHNGCYSAFLTSLSTYKNKPRGAV